MRWLKRTRKPGRATARRRPPAGPWRRRLWTAGAVLVGLAALAGSGAWLAASGVVHRAAAEAAEGVESAQHTAGLELRRLTVTGREHTSARALRRALGLRTGMPVLAIDLEAAHRRVEALPWVRHARLERRLPDRLRVVLDEHRPIALWQGDGGFALVSARGERFRPPHPEAFDHLPVVGGAGAAARAMALRRLLRRAPALAERVRAAVRVDRRRWDLQLRAPGERLVTVRLPAVHPGPAWRRLAGIQDRQNLLGRDIRVIDMRLEDRLIVRLTPEAARRRQRRDGEA